MTITITGRTPRSFFRHITDGINDATIPILTPYTTITNKDTKTKIRNICCTILWAISGGQPMQLIGDAFDRNFILQIEPLNTVCKFYQIHANIQYDTFINALSATLLTKNNKYC